MRPGRFEKLLYLGVADTTDAQLFILKALTRKFWLQKSCSLEKVAQACPLLYTGADFYALCADAYLKATSRTIATIEKSLESINKNSIPGHPHPMSSVYYLDHLAPLQEKQVHVSLEDFVQALQQMKPSVSASELKRYEALRAKFEK